MVDAALRGIGQILFMNHPVTGALFLAALAAGRPWAAVLCLAAALAATATARVLKYDGGLAAAGLLTFNGALMGLLAAAVLVPEWSPAVLLCAVAGAAVSVPIMAFAARTVAGRLQVPPLSLPFALVGLAALALGPVLVRPHLKPAASGGAADPALRGAADGDAVGLLEGLANATFRGIGQVFLTDSAALGIIAVLAVAVCSRIAAAMAVLGSFAGAVTGLLLGADGHSVFSGLWGYCGAVTAVALFGVVLEPTRRSFLFTLGACAAATVLYGGLAQALVPLGLVPLSLPFVAVIIGAALAGRSGGWLQAVPVAQYSTAETRLQLRRS
jgi:urea transporter